MTETGERRRDVDRVMTFVDAIVAIAITLLVLPLADLTHRSGHGDGAAHPARSRSHRRAVGP